MPTKREVLEPYIKQAVNLKDVIRMLGDRLAGVGVAAAPLAERGLAGIGAKQTGARLGRVASRQSVDKFDPRSPYQKFFERIGRGERGPMGRRVDALNRFVDKDRRMMQGLGAGTLGAGGLGLYGGYRGLRSLIGGEEETPVAKKEPVEKTSAISPAARTRLVNTIMGILGGGTTGAAAGALTADPGDRLEGAMRGGLAGGVIGGGIGLHDRAINAGLGKLQGRTGNAARKSFEITRGTLPILGGAHAGTTKKKKEEPKEKKEPKETEEKEAQLGTPFTDGLLQFCFDCKINGEQVADLLEKGAQAGGWIGEECQGLLDRMVK